MSTSAAVATNASFAHRAVLYSDDRSFVAQLAPFLHEGVQAGEAVLVCVPEPRTRLLQSALGSNADGIRFENMVEVGRNPARIIPLWADFLSTSLHEGRAVRGVGEPINEFRTAAEIDECLQHEQLLNVAFDKGPAWTLLCPYNSTNAAPHVLSGAHTTHPVVVGEREHAYDSATYRVDRPKDGWLDGPVLPTPEHILGELEFAGIEGTGDLRRSIAVLARECGLRGERLGEFELVLSELLANSLMHGGGAGVVRVWRERDRMVCEVADAGFIENPLAGRCRPLPEQVTGRGLWIANNLCDLVQLRSSREGTTVRLHMRLS